MLHPFDRPDPVLPFNLPLLPGWVRLYSLHPPLAGGLNGRVSVAPATSTKRNRARRTAMSSRPARPASSSSSMGMAWLFWLVCFLIHSSCAADMVLPIRATTLRQPSWWSNMQPKKPSTMTNGFSGGSLIARSMLKSSRDLRKPSDLPQHEEDGRIPSAYQGTHSQNRKDLIF